MTFLVAAASCTSNSSELMAPPLSVLDSGFLLDLLLLFRSLWPRSLDFSPSFPEFLLVFAKPKPVRAKILSNPTILLVIREQTFVK